MLTSGLNTLIEIWKYTSADNSGGTPIENFQLCKKKYAYMKVRGGGTNESDLGRLPFTSVEFTIRYDAQIDYKCQIKYNNIFYQINHIEILDKKVWMRIITNVVNERI